MTSLFDDLTKGVARSGAKASAKQAAPKAAGRDLFDALGGGVKGPQSSFDEATADHETGLGVWDRLNAGFKATEAGELGYYQNKYGEKNVAKRDGKIFVRKKGDEHFTRADPPPSGVLSFVKDLPGDVADIAGDIIEGVPGTVGAAAGAGVGAFAGIPGGPAGIIGGGTAGGLAGGMIGDAAGSIARQATSALVPGDDKLTFGDRVALTSNAVALGTVGEGIAKGGKAAIQALPEWAVNVPRKAMRALSKSEVDKSAKLTTETGVEFTEAQKSGSRLWAPVEGFLRRNLLTRDEVMSKDISQVQQAATFFEKVAGAAAKSKSGAVVVGDNVGKAVLNLRDRLVTNRSNQWKTDFDAVDRLTGNKSIFPVDEIQRTIQQLIREHGARGGPAERGQLVSSLKSISKDLGDEPLDARSFASNMADWNSKSRKPKGTLAGVDAIEVQQEVARTMKAAYSRTLDIMEQTGDKAIADSVRTARNNWAKNSTDVDSVLETAFFKFVRSIKKSGKEPDRIADVFLENRLNASEKRKAMAMLERAGPEVAQEVRAQFVRSFVEKNAATGELANDLAFSPQRARSFATKRQNDIEAVLGGDPKTLASFNRGIEAVRKISVRGDTEGSVTVSLQTIAATLASAGAIAAGASADAASGLASAAGLKVLARVLMDDQGSRLLASAAASRNNATAYRKSLERLATYVAGRPHLTEGIKDDSNNEQSK